MSVMNQTCDGCKKSFELDSDDLAFFETMQVEPPPYCARCGVQRMMALRNERIVHRRPCDLCKKPGLGMYHAQAPYVVYCHDCWYGDTWDGLTHAQMYDISRPILDQCRDLQHQVPREALVILNSTNCDFSNHIRTSKDGYFSFLVADAERVLYSVWTLGKDVFDSHKVWQGEMVGECVNINKCFRCAYVMDSSESTDCYFSYDLKNCNNCLFSSNLRSKSYHIRNKKVSREEYDRAYARIMNGSYATLQASLKEFEFIKQKALRRYAVMWKSQDVSGNYLNECGRCRWIFDGENNEEVRYTASVLNAKKVAYCYSIGIQPAEYVFGSAVIKGGSQVVGSFNCLTSNDLIYCDSCISCSDCIACVGLKQKKYCILNKQYSPEEYAKIKADLAAQGELSKFLPPSFGTFAYNESAANDFYPLKKEQALALGFGWQEDFPFLSGKETMPPEKMSDNIKDALDTITKEMFKCVRCSRNYTMVRTETKLRRALNLPLARECPQCRMARRRAERLPYDLWRRSCMCDRGGHLWHDGGRCKNEFETPYAPDRTETVFCEPCYQHEVV